MIRQFVKIQLLVFLFWSCGDEKETAVVETAQDHSGTNTDSVNAAKNGEKFRNDVQVDLVSVEIGKFHRQEAKLHPDNPWVEFALPEDPSITLPYYLKRDQRRYTLFFSSFTELLNGLKELSTTDAVTISLMTLNVHGGPGGFLLPKDEEAKQSDDCRSWRSLFKASDDEVYDSYYTLPELSSIPAISGDDPEKKIQSRCWVMTGQWQDAVDRDPEFQKMFFRHLVIQFSSCLVGFGAEGRKLLDYLAKALLKDDGYVLASPMYVAIDWSLVGIGFWDYIDPEQYQRDALQYPKTKMDALLVIPGVLNIAARENGIYNNYRMNVPRYFPRLLLVENYLAYMADEHDRLIAW